MGFRFVPNSVSYETVNRLNNYADILLYTSTLVTIAISFLGYYELIPDLKNLLIGLNILFICIFVYLDNRANYIFTKAEMRRRLDWLDNSFQTNFSGKKSKDYFTNDHLSPGLYKLAVNCFENSFHTQFIISKMLPKLITQTIIIVLVFIISAYIGNREIIRMFFELSLPAILIQKLIKALYFSTRMADVQDHFKSLFNDLLKINFDDKTAESLRDILEYETALSWASTPLDSKIFWKHKVKLAQDWEELKQEYNIKAL
ncbi:hypothetical protein ESA94_13785 [Lacibacter luteus]|uniref:Uncharacterized protein n=1 Tax=Lacibacter luteus TaxID=2508719 RepID=A0A4Q1CGX4_9BACT|nr:hypothetical protein [Lacibacter luteus]RXK59207.1 hypothetical protein ESA94_13785 [Lacibacter luteus]